MAPTAPKPDQASRPSARALRLARISGSIHPLLPAKTFRPDAAVSDSFLSSKRDKRLIKHSSFVARVSSSTSSRVGKKKPLRRRRSTADKLKTSLQGLADALPDLEDDGALAGSLEDAAADARRKIRHRSIKSKPGALKRKEMVVKGEMERFGASMARLTASDPAAAASGDQKPAKADAQPPPVTDRWAALRGYISATMEQAPAFAGKK